VAALDGAVALVEMDDVAVLVAEHLHLDVLGARDVFLEEDAALPNARSASPCASSRRCARSAGLWTTRMPRPPPPNAALMMSGKPIDFAVLSASSRSVIGSSVREGGHADLLRERAGGGFVAHHVEELGARADEDQAGGTHGAGEVGVLGEEAVTGVDGVDALFLRDGNDAVDVEVGGDGALAGADLVGLVGFVAVMQSRSSCA